LRRLRQLHPLVGRRAALYGPQSSSVTELLDQDPTHPADIGRRHSSLGNELGLVFPEIQEKVMIRLDHAVEGIPVPFDSAMRGLYYTGAVSECCRIRTI
jgi:hypothetical protein